MKRHIAHHLRETFHFDSQGLAGRLERLANPRYVSVIHRPVRTGYC